MNTSPTKVVPRVAGLVALPTTPQLHYWLQKIYQLYKTLLTVVLLRMVSQLKQKNLSQKTCFLLLARPYTSSDFGHNVFELLTISIFQHVKWKYCHLIALTERPWT